MNISGHDLQKGIEFAANLSKFAANVTNPPQATPQATYKEGDSTSQAHNQTVEVKLANPEAEKKPMVFKEKNETHIHKYFPDNRNLTAEECELRKFEIQLEYDEKDKAREFAILMDDRRREDEAKAAERDRIREEKERKDREEREAHNRKWAKRALICGAIIGGVGLVDAGYRYYTDSRRPFTPHIPGGMPGAQIKIPDVIKGEGKVK